MQPVIVDAHDGPDDDDAHVDATTRVHSIFRVRNTSEWVRCNG